MTSQNLTLGMSVDESFKQHEYNDYDPQSMTQMHGMMIGNKQQ
jgi:hypothetical protein